MRLHGAGVAADLPRGWEGRIRRGPQAPSAATAAAERDGRAPALPPEEDLATAHLGTFPLPADRGDFGSGAVERMMAGDAFIALLEYEAASAATALFARAGLPRRLTPQQFSPASLQRTLTGQAGTQVFCNEAGRAFCLYVVLGNVTRAARTIGEVNRVLATVRLERR